MALVYTDDQNYTNIADAIRTRLGTEDHISPTDMADKIMNITYGVKEIKGAAEDEFREGSVVLTPEDLGALPADATAKTAEKLETAVNITIGEATKSFDGSSGITFSKSEMGVMEAVATPIAGSDDYILEFMQ